MVDVTVRGAGIFGLSIAWTCLARGARVRVVDPHGPGAGASGGLVGALAPHVPENWNDKKRFQLESLLMAEPFWRAVEATGGVDPGYARLGRVQPVADDAALALAHRRAGTARDLWGDAATWSVLPEAGVPWAPRSPTGMVILDTLSARLHPRRACAALAAAIRARGGEIAAEAPDRGRVIHATGIADLEALSVHFGKTVGSAVKGQGALLHFDARDRPQLFADGLHIVPHADGTTAIGSTSERDFDDAHATDAQLDELIDRAMQAVPILHGARVVERWAGLRPRSRSRAPMLGPHPLHPGQFIANGGFKIGFGMAPKVAETMATLVLDDRDTIPEAFRPEVSL
ncbi:FAD-binding oxidoreductase [Roseovarius sp. SCSIO 43702]|uniref:NAD(P)/FAD-dependent oxidoreductase n=1 Tax=Roseovarius sp. SCSIO 43702 TaxID=2823043 RepID=UPI001C7322DF|nr:FAD-dependent oxidoreductase [Roseovarius sp. SCSIO 43702]QYX58652.1 FAD-binding oxidoreductase [Roseovarius sp. SCSIO 43702]